LRCSLPVIAALALLGVGVPVSNAAAVPPPSSPRISDVQVSNPHGSIDVSVSHLCDPCSLRVAWAHGADARYPTTYEGAAHRRDFGHTTSMYISFGKGHAPDLTTYRMTFWAYLPSEGRYSMPVHRQREVGEYLRGLARFVDIDLPAHAHSLHVRLDRSRFYNYYELRGYKVWLRQGDSSPFRRAQPPSTKPIRTCSGNACERDDGFVLRHLHDLTEYRVAVYGYDRYGHYRGTWERGFTRAEGFHVTGSPQAAMPGFPIAASAVDQNGGAHVVGLPDSSAFPPPPAVYATRFDGDGDWHRTQVDGSAHEQYHSRVFAATSLDGSEIFAVIAACNGYSSARTGVADRTLPTPVVFLPADNCNDDSDTPYAEDAAALPDGRIAVLLQDGTVLIGEPGGQLTADTTLPVAFSPRMASDPATGELHVADRDANGDVRVWTRAPDGTWTDALAYHPDVTVRLRVVSVSAYDGQVALGVSRYSATTDVPGPDDGLFLLQRADSGGWSNLARVPHSRPTDDYLVVAINRWSGHLHVVFSRPNPNAPLEHAGLRHEAFRDGSWSGLEALTHWGGDNAQSVDFGRTGPPVVGFFRG
jgi:hypothetical protein